MSEVLSPVRVVFSSLEDARRVVFSRLAGLSPEKRARVASLIAADLRDAGLLGCSVEQHYKGVDVAALLSRTPEWVRGAAERGLFGEVFKDDGGWLIPASGVHAYLASHSVGSAPMERVA